MAAYYFDGTDFKTRSQSGTIKVALNSVMLLQEPVSVDYVDPSCIEGLKELDTAQNANLKNMVFRVTGNFSIA